MVYGCDNVGDMRGHFRHTQTALHHAKDAYAATTPMLKRALQNVRREMRNLKTGKQENLHCNLDKVMTAQEKLAHERSGHASVGSRCETCIKNVTTTKTCCVGSCLLRLGLGPKQPARLQGEDPFLAGPRGETFAREDWNALLRSRQVFCVKLCAVQVEGWACRQVFQQWF